MPSEMPNYQTRRQRLVDSSDDMVYSIADVVEAEEAIDRLTAGLRKRWYYSQYLYAEEDRLGLKHGTLTTEYIS